MKKLAIAIAAAVLAVGAQANTNMFSFSVPSTTPTDFNSTGTLGLFNTALGVLTGVSLTYGADLSGTITLTNGAGAGGNGTIKGTTNADVFFASVNLDIAALLNPLSLAYNTGFHTIAPGGTFTSATLSDTFSASPVVGLLASLQNAGGGTFAVGCNSLTGFGTTGGGGFAGGSQTTFGGCNMKIVYTFTDAPPPAVPEPASLALVGLALAGIAASRKSKKA